MSAKSWKEKDRAKIQNAKLRRLIKEESSNRKMIRFHIKSDESADRSKWKKSYKIFKNIKKEWVVDPTQESINFIKELDRKDVVVGDFGSGDCRIENFFKKTTVKVESYDVLKIDSCTIKQDFWKLSTPSNHFDVVVCCLSLNGGTKGKLREVYRTLKRDGVVIIWQLIPDADKVLKLMDRFKIVESTVVGEFRRILAKTVNL